MHTKFHGNWSSHFKGINYKHSDMRILYIRLDELHVYRRSLFTQVIEVKQVKLQVSCANIQRHEDKGRSLFVFSTRIRQCCVNWSPFKLSSSQDVLSTVKYIHYIYKFSILLIPLWVVELKTVFSLHLFLGDVGHGKSRFF